MSRDDLAREWRELSAAWIKEVREGRNPTRKGLLDGPMLDAWCEAASRRVRAARGEG